MARPRVLVTGASGLIGGLVTRRLNDRYAFSGFSRTIPARSDIPYQGGSVLDVDAVRSAINGMDMVLHLAGETGHLDDWQRHLDVTLQGTVNVLQAAADARVGRVVLMSTGSTMGGYEHDDTLPYGKLARGEWDGLEPWPMLDHTAPPRPNSAYAWAKLAGEGAGRWFADYRSMSVIIIRSGAVLPSDRPELIRHFPGYLAHADAIQMVDRCLRAPKHIRFGIFDSISENRYRWRDTTPAKELLGWRPTGTADDFDADVVRAAAPAE